MSETTFHSAVEAIFQNWSALQLTVSQGAAGPESKDIAKWMVSATVQWFSENKDLECDEVEDFLITIINFEDLQLNNKSNSRRLLGFTLQKRFTLRENQLFLISYIPDNTF